MLQQFFKWLLVDERAIDRNPMDRVRQPNTPTKLIPVMREADPTKVLDAGKGKGFASPRDEALTRLYANTGARLSEVGNLCSGFRVSGTPVTGWSRRSLSRWSGPRVT